MNENSWEEFYEFLILRIHRKIFNKNESSSSFYINKSLIIIVTCMSLINVNIHDLIKNEFRN